MTVILIIVVAALHLVFIRFGSCWRPHSSVDENVRLGTVYVTTATQSDCGVVAVNP